MPRWPMLRARRRRWSGHGPALRRRPDKGLGSSPVPAAAVRDVVALGAEHHDGRPDVAQVDADAVGRDQPGRGQAVAHEQLVHDVLDLGAVQEHMAAPPFLEAQVALRLGVDLGVQVVLLAPERVGRVQVLEVLHQPGAVELAVADVAGERGEPAATQQAAGIAHGIHAAPARPVGQRRAGHDDGAEQLGTHGGGHHDLPAGLAIGHHHGLAFRVGMAGDDLFQEARLGLITSSTVWVGMGWGRKVAK